MKYIIICMTVYMLCVAASVGLSRLFGFSAVKRGAAAALISILLAVLVGFSYMSVYYHADDTAAAYLADSETVAVTRIDTGYYFDGPGSERAIVFFPGAKVEEIAYAPLLFTVAEQGTDCFLLKVPLRMAFFDGNAPDELIDRYPYESWYMMGHSLGGIVAVRYAAAHVAATDGVILLASYADRELAPTARLLSIYGSEDGLLDREQYEKGRKLWPKDNAEVIIDGGNHAGFGNYGVQRGDGKASVTSAQQQEQTAETILRFLSARNVG